MESQKHLGKDSDIRMIMEGRHNNTGASLVLSVLILSITAYICLTKVVACERYAIDQSKDEDVSYTHFKYASAKEYPVEQDYDWVSAREGKGVDHD